MAVRLNITGFNTPSEVSDGNADFFCSVFTIRNARAIIKKMKLKRRITMLNKYKGVFPAFYACYDDEGNVSVERTKELVEFLIEKGVAGLYVGGSSGECIYLSVEDRKKTLEAVMEVARGRIRIIAHVACNNTKDSCELARHAQSVGADAIAAIPPIYFRLPERAIAKYWNDISAAAPDTDFVIYNIPQLAGVALTLPLLDEMMKNPRVVGVKNSSMPVQDIQMFKRQAAMAGKELVVFNGPDEQFVSGRLIGADAGIGGTYAVMPEVFVAMDKALEAGDFERARLLQNAANEVIYAMCSAKGNMYAVAKAVLRLRTGKDFGSVRAPLLSLQDGDEAVVQKAFELVEKAVSI